VNIVIYDCEIKRGIPARGEEKIPGIEYCKGWGDHAGMGVSVTGVYDYDEDRYRVFCDDNVDEMLELFASADLLVGFNSIRFDDRLLVATYPDYADITTTRYDLLVETWRAAGLKPSWGSPKTHGGFGLDAMCEANFGVRKSGHGAMAPVLWQQGKIGAVIDYCLNDIRMTKMLLDCAMGDLEVINPKDGVLTLRNPIVTFEEAQDEAVAEDVEAGKDPMYRQGKMSSSRQVGELNLDVLQHEQANKVLPPLNQPSDPHHWDNLVVEIEDLAPNDRWMVAVHTEEGLLIKRNLRLHEWSCDEMSSTLLNKDGPALVKYLREHEAMCRRAGEDDGDA